MPNPASKVKASGYPRKRPANRTVSTQQAGQRVGGASNSVTGFVHTGRTFRPFAKK